jgi:ATP-dependent DNA helicase RecQ
MPTIWKSSEDNQLSRFGLEQFRPGQVDVIQSVMKGDDCLCVMPTGGGKSLCYQYPAVVRPGLVMVVSPLIALMKDQVDGLQELGIQAACINSSQTIDQQGEILRQTANGELDLLYVAPERLRSPRFLQTISDIEIQLLAIDEAHCISQWGHDFRPDYARLGNLRRKIGKPQTIALTATATDDVRKDILKQLELDECQVFVNGFARENLFLEVAAPVNIQDKNQRLTTFLHANPGAGIIYASTRKKCEEIVELLNRGSRKFGFYHGGMLPEDRKSVQERFMDGDVDVIIATNAFGMGIDKSDIRFVVHYNLPGTLEAYYQEAGRAFYFRKAIVLFRSFLLKTLTLRQNQSSKSINTSGRKAKILLS